ncbi:MFS transporter [Nonomuraea sp. B1E8]|uniref:MFS transporter n=1 Tax=unclassified Nonomuraea TaxID=2593643 RepID=UPI00325ED2A3
MRPQRAIAAVFAIHGAVGGSLATRIPWLQDHLDLGPGLLGLALLFPSIGAIAGLPLAARLAHRFGGRAATRALLAAWCASVILPVLSPAPGWLFAAFLLYGGAAGMCDVVMNAHAVVLERQLGRSIMSGLHGMWSVGSLTAGGVGALAAQAGIDARIHLPAVSLVLIALGAAAGRSLPPGEASAHAAAPRRLVLPSRGILAIGAVGFCATFAEGAGAGWAAVYLSEIASAGPGAAAAGYTVLMVSMAGARLAGDRVIRLLGPATAVRAGGVVATAGCVMVVAARSPALGITGFALLGLGVAVVVPLVFAAAGNAGTTPGAGVAGVATITYVSGLSAPAVIGWVADWLSYPAAFVMITGVVALLILLAPVLRPAPASTPSREEALSAH